MSAPACSGTDPTPMEIHCALRGATYPARPGGLIAYARANHAPPSVLRVLATLPDHPIVGPNQVCMALFGRHRETQPGP
ncbi:DUF2795 domain-containing protein (plasmid) [Embleya sp. NBC_00888]|uniref:DUF2795 domain-containing protein n=1 Tax=Embleya sp. NBC_00888 TaxID=2975960 RepID=UPI002F9089E9|nr:DUF2795 domain-containing protein [Embleya sp. NBC_00888]